MQIIGHIESDFPEKFGIPRQSGLADKLVSRVVFEPEYRVKEAFRGLEGYSHIWVIWEFSEAKREGWSPTVRPPRLGGNRRVGVFASRSPFRPNPVGLSAVRLERIEYGGEGPVLYISGGDMMDKTPVLDIKPYIPYADAYPEAKGGFSVSERESLEVNFPSELLEIISEEKREALIQILSQDPRPAYQDDLDRIYTMSFAGHEISFFVRDGALTVTKVLS